MGVFKGKKGVGNKNSGRKPAVDELVKNDVLKKSWGRIRDKFNKKNKTAEDEKYLDIVSLELAKKTIPQNINLTGSLELTQILDLCE